MAENLNVACFYTLAIDSFPPSSTRHLSVHQRVQNLPVEHDTSDDHPPSRQVHPRGQSGSGHQDPEGTLTESALYNVSLVKAEP